MKPYITNSLLLAFGLILFFFLCISSYAQNDQYEGKIEPKAWDYYGNGARAMAMGGAYIAVGGDPAAGFWNPAGLASIINSQVSVSYNFSGKDTSSFAGLTASDRTVGSYEFPLDLSAIDYAALTLPLRQEDLFMVHQVAYRVVRNFGFSGALSNSIAFTVPGTETNTQYYEWNSSGSLQEISYSLGFKAFDFIYIGASYHHYFGGYDYDNYYENDYSSVTLDTYLEEITSSANWSFLGDNFSIGIIIKPAEFLNVGFVFHTNYELKVEYKRNIDYKMTVTGLDPINTTYESNDETAIKRPSEWGIGIALMPMKNLTIAADYTYSNWLSDQNEDGEYINGTINDYTMPYDPNGTPSDAESLNYPTFTKPDDYDQQAETYLRIGAEYILDFKDFDIYLRGGFWTHNSISLDSNGDPITFTGITAGAGITYNFIKFDIAWAHQTGTYAFIYGDEEGVNGDVTSSYLYAQVALLIESF